MKLGLAMKRTSKTFDFSSVDGKLMFLVKGATDLEINLGMRKRIDKF